MNDAQDKLNPSDSESVMDNAEHRRMLDDIRREKEFSESLINSSFDGILAFDHNCRYTLWNRAMERISGLPSQDVVGRIAFEVFPFLKETGEDRFFHEALSGQTVIANDRPFLIPQSGLEGLFEARYSPLCSPSGEVIGGLGIIRDITEQSRADRALRESESKYRMLIEYASDGIAIYDRQGRITDVNPELCEMIGYEREEALGRAVTDFIDPDDLAATPLRWDQLKDGKAVLGERVLLRKDGTRVCIELSARMLSDGHVQTIIRDITKRKEAEEQIKQLNIELERRVIARTAQLESTNRELQKEIAERERLEAQKDEFIAVASHELRTPISVIKGYTKMALRTVEEGGDQRLARNLRIVDEKTDHLTRLITEMLDASMLDGEYLPLKRDRFDLAQLVRHMVSDIQLTESEFTFTLDLPNEPVYVQSDRQSIESVVNNLLNNAVKYTGRYADGKRLVEVKLRVEEGMAITSIRDYGVGIPAEQKEKVFGRFFRADNVTNARYPYPGMGLGLYISYNIVERHKGRMWVDSAEGEGSTFYFALPLADSPPQ